MLSLYSNTNDDEWPGCSLSELSIDEPLWPYPLVKTLKKNALKFLVNQNLTLKLLIANLAKYNTKWCKKPENDWIPSKRVLSESYPIHGLSQQGVWVSFWTPKPLKSTPQDTQKNLWGISLNVNLKHIFKLFHCHIIPMILYKDIMPYFDKYKHVHGWNLSILWSPLKIWTPKNFTLANFRHPVSKSWLRPWSN